MDIASTLTYARRGVTRGDNNLAGLQIDQMVDQFCERIINRRALNKLKST